MPWVLVGQLDDPLTLRPGDASAAALSLLPDSPILAKRRHSVDPLRATQLHLARAQARVLTRLAGRLLGRRRLSVPRASASVSDDVFLQAGTRRSCGTRVLPLPFPDGPAGVRISADAQGNAAQLRGLRLTSLKPWLMPLVSQPGTWRPRGSCLPGWRRTWSLGGRRRAWIGPGLALPGACRFPRLGRRLAVRRRLVGDLRMPCCISGWASCSALAYRPTAVSNFARHPGLRRALASRRRAGTLTDRALAAGETNVMRVSQPRLRSVIPGAVSRRSPLP